MIKDINFNYNCIEFSNESGRAIVFKVTSPYKSIFSFLQVSNGLILLLDWSKESLLEERRRNVIKIDEDGDIVWTVKDKMDIWKEKFPNDEIFHKSREGGCFNRIYTENGKIVLSEGSGALFFLDPATGSIEHWKTERW